MRTWISSSVPGTFVVLLVIACPVLGQSDTLPGTSQETVTLPSAQLDAIMQRLEALEAQKVSGKQKSSEADEWQDVSAEKWTIKLGGRALADYVMFADQDAGNQARFGDIDNYFEWRRLRLKADGEGYGVYFYKLELEFEPEGATGLGDSGVVTRDCYVGIKEVPWLGTVTIGNSKQPISLEILNSSNYISFMERSLPRMFLVEERRLGVHAANHIPSEALTWDYGIFLAKPVEEDHEVISDDPGVRLVGRVVTTPYYCEGGRHFVHVGLGGAWQTVGEDNRWRWRSRPEVHEGPYFIDSGTFDSGSLYTLNLESALNWGAFSLQSEVYYNRNKAMADDIDLYGAYAEASWFLTGESRPYSRSRGVFERLKPHTNFWLVRGSDGLDMGWGAWQLAARWSAVDLSDAAFQGANRGIQHDMSVGVNWYWNPNVRWMVNWIHTWNDYDVAAGGYTDGQADILAVRGQLDF